MKSIVCVLLMAMLSCAPNSNELDTLLNNVADHSEPDMENSDDNTLSSKWYEGNAEVSTFSLTQNRYNDIHKGEVVQIFVTEDFLTDKQVKNDSYTNSNSTPIFKNNRVRKFTTGIYDYSMFTSVFTDVKNKKDINTLKVTMSSQDWCGQSFTQLNYRKNKYQLSGFSYFENEGDQKKELNKALLLDEVFNLIRINPETLPLGNVDVIPSIIYSRLKHQESKPIHAIATLEKYMGELVKGESLMLYKIKIPDYKAEFDYIFSSKGTHEIMAWSEKYPSVFDGKIRATTAVRKAVQWLPYWEKNSVSDESLRNDLLLGTN